MSSPDPFRTRQLLRCAGLGMALGLGALPQPVAVEAADRPSFRPEPCNLPGLAPRLAARLRCGTVAVPRERGSADAGQFRLAVAIVAADPDRRQADPVVYVAGGPGSPLTARAALIAEHEAAVIAPDRDLILVDQRGAGRSEPAVCPGLSRQHMAIFAAGSGQQALVRAWRESFGACRAEMAAGGLSPDWFGTHVTAADFETVRQALGIRRWTVYALSYGTAVAMTMMAERPESLRAVVLDSVFPPDPLPMTLPQTFGRALDLLFAACRDDPACAGPHPDLEAAFGAALRGLDAEPLPVPLRPGLGLATLTLRAQVFRLVVDRALYSRQGMARLPAFIDAARDRKPMAMQALIGDIAGGYLAASAGDMAAVECRDRASWRDPPPDDAGEPPVSGFVAGLCKDWSMPGPPPVLAHDTKVPSLILSGTADPITPPAFAEIAAAAMGARARLVEFAHVGHGAEPSTACAETLVAAFIRNPSEPIDATCASHVPPVTFQ